MLTFPFLATIHAQRKQKQKLLKLLHLVWYDACCVSLQCVSSTLLQCLTSQPHGTHTEVHLNDGRNFHFPFTSHSSSVLLLHLHSDGVGYTTADDLVWILEASALLTFASIAFSTAWPLHARYIIVILNVVIIVIVTVRYMQVLIGSLPKGRASGAFSNCPQAEAGQRTYTLTPSARAWSSVLWLPALQSSTACRSHSGQLGTVSARLAWPKVLNCIVRAQCHPHHTDLGNAL